MDEKTPSDVSSQQKKDLHLSFWLGVSAALAVIFAIIALFFAVILLRQGTLLPSAQDKNIPAQDDTQKDEAQDEIVVAPVTDADWVKGDRNAPITIVEFSDTECPFCKQFHETMQSIVKEYDGKVKWVYRHFPLEQLHPRALKEAEALECAGELGGNDGFWKYADRLYAVTPANNKLDPAQLPEIARTVGLNVAKFTECLNSGKYAEKVQNYITQAENAGGRGTPYSVILVDDKKIPINGAQPLAQVKRLLDPLIK